MGKILGPGGFPAPTPGGMGMIVNEKGVLVPIGNRWVRDTIYITKCPLDTDEADVFDAASDDPKLSEEMDKFLAAREDLVVHIRVKNCVRTNLNYYVALYGGQFGHMAM